MTVSKAKLASNARYRGKQDFIQIRVGQGDRDRYKAAAAHLGVSLNQLFVNAVEEIIADRLVGVDLSTSPSPNTSESTE